MHENFWILVYSRLHSNFLIKQSLTWSFIDFVAIFNHMLSDGSKTRSHSSLESLVAVQELEFAINRALVGLL